MSRVAKPKQADPVGGDFPRKYSKLIEDDRDFIELAQRSSYDELEKLIAEYQDHIATLEKDMSCDLDLQNLKQEVKDASEPYVNGCKVAQAKTKYCVYIKRSLGKTVNS